MTTRGICEYPVIGGPMDGSEAEPLEPGFGWLGFRDNREIVRKPLAGDNRCHFYRLANCRKTGEKYWCYLGNDPVRGMSGRKPPLSLHPYGKPNDC